MEVLTVFSNLADLYAKYGYKLYLVGGSVRDYLLKIPSSDLDLCTDATPDETKEFLPDANYRFAKFGTVSFNYDLYKVEITTLRVEQEYTDSRHPKEVKFVKNLELDYKRRDFTVNALYLDRNLNVFDYCGGLQDLKSKTLKMIGDPLIRFEEDPLRIVRALRFKLKLNFSLDETLESAIHKKIHLLKNLNQEKLDFEIRKMLKMNQEKAIELLDAYQIDYKTRN